MVNKKRKYKLSKFKKTMLIILIIYLIIAFFPRQNNYKFDNPMRKEDDMPILIAHGGGNKEFPDNTLEAFYNAYSVDSRVMMETDVSITKDGVVILSHDTTLDRRTNVTGAIADWNYTDLLSYGVDFGYTNPVNENNELDGERKHFVGPDGEMRYPTDVKYPDGVEPRNSEIFLVTSLEDMLVAFPNSRINVEIKQSGELGQKALKEILRLLEVYDAFDRVVLASFHEELYLEYKRLLKEGEVPENFMFSPSTKCVTKFFVLRLINLDLFFGDNICVFQLPMEQYGFNLATKGFVRRAHKHNLAVHYWTINDVEDMKHLIEIGADGIMTDYPHLLKDVYDNYNKK